MAMYLDLDDAVANVTGDVAKRELDELRRQRDELAEALRELVEAGEDVWDFNRPCLQEGRNALANLDSEQAEQPAVPEWISCSERLPTQADRDCDGQVWACSPTYGVVCADWDIVGDGDYTDWMCTGLVRPWPPKGGSD